MEWPAEMPQPVYDQIQIGAPAGSVLRNKMDKGPPKQRRRFTASIQPVSLTFEPVTFAAFAAFERFYDEDIGGGALPFDMPHPLTGAPRSFQFNQGGEPWQVIPVGKDALQLKVSLELRP